MLHLLRQEFARLDDLPESCLSLAFDTDRRPHDEIQAETELVHLEPFQADVYLANRENETLRAAVARLPNGAA